MSLVSLSAERERVIARLSDAFATDVLDVDAFEDRVTLAHRADSVAALEALVQDLPASTALVPAPSLVVTGGGDRPGERTMRCIFSGIERSGAWTMPRRLHVRCTFGGADLDLREADFGPGVTELDIRCTFGGVRLIVPPGLQVEMDGSAIFGGFQHLERMQNSAGAVTRSGPMLRVSGRVVFGGVQVETRLRGEPVEGAGQASKRHRRELRQRHSRPALPAPSRKDQNR